MHLAFLLVIINWAEGCEYGEVGLSHFISICDIKA